MQFDTGITLPDTGTFAPQLSIDEYHPALQSILKVAPFYAELLGDGLMLLVSSLDTYLYYKPCPQIPLNLKPGNHPKPNGGVNKATQAGHRIVELRQRDEASFWLISYPVKAPDKTIVGNIILGMPIEKQQKLVDMSNSLIEKSKGALPRIQRLSSSTEKLDETNNEFKGKFEEITGKINDINSLLSKIKEISRKSNMLGINASIEAAKAGESGAGFGVVAEQVRNLALRTSDLVSEVTSTIEGLDTSVESFNHNLDKMGSMAGDQGEAYGELKEAVNEIISMSDGIHKQAKDLGIQ